MLHTFPTAKRAARTLAPAALTLLLGLAAFGCAQPPPPQAAPPAPQAQPAPKSGTSLLGYLAGKDGQPLTGRDIRNTPPFSTAYRALLRRNKLKDGWLTHFNGPSWPVRTVAIGGAEYLYVRGCKPQACTAQNIGILYCEKEKATYAMLHQNGETLWLGEPSDEIKQAFAQIEKIEPPK